ncbi:preprotein translocase subunit SecG [Paracoccus sp. MBLB3053]|uniref:Protein-export membrane protein SecG n=1 Tax=Paracoccus aurantius TaxID=3073814 RepID=A0ABU2HT03_9RHOB|nr:preprotein translocase subunit SecG [Paracoccus sp. MBLB3053]MDS9468177.1 preprotein translocase subunit SecG [Paracoccus sp. MBLB3053]
MKGPVVENVVLTVHLILAVLLIGVVLLQRSEGGGLGMGSGSGGGVMTGRQAANALSRATWILAGAFLVTSLTLTVIAAQNSSGGSIVDQLNIGSEPSDEPTTTLPGIGEYSPPPAAGQPVLPPVPGGNVPAPAQTEAPAIQPVMPPAAETPATETPAEPAPAAEAPAQTN